MNPNIELFLFPIKSNLINLWGKCRKHFIPLLLNVEIHQQCAAGNLFVHIPGAK